MCQFTNVKINIFTYNFSEWNSIGYVAPSRWNILYAARTVLFLNFVESNQIWIVFTTFRLIDL